MASSIINSDDGSVSGTTGLKTTGGDDGELAFESSGTEAMRIDSSGNVGIGTASPAVPLDVDIGTNNNAIYCRSSDRYCNIAMTDDVGSVKLGSDNGALFVEVGGDTSFGSFSEAMRIDSSGRVGIGTSSPVYSLDVRSGAMSPAAVFGRSTDGTQRTVVSFDSDTQSATVGTIAITNSATAYNTASDYRLKEDWQPMSGSIDRLKNLNPVNFAWKADGSRVDGFLAHEAAEVVPEAVTGEKDAVEAIGNITDAEGNVVRENVKEPEEMTEGQVWTKTEDRPVYQGIDQAKLVPLLTAALQEAVSKIEALETRIAALEA